MSQTKQVTVYSTSICGFCRMVERYLDEKGVEYLKKDIEKDPSARQELLNKAGDSFRGVPVTDIDGHLVLGYDRPALESALNG